MLNSNITTRVAGRIIPVLAALWLLTSCSSPEPPQLAGGTLLPTPREVVPFTLVDHHNAPFTRDSLRGQWSFAFFGYTHCPDVCPNALGMLKRVETLLEADGVTPLPRVLFVSVDPARDTPEVLASYVAYFHPAFVGVTGEDAELKRLTRQLGILYGRSPGETDKDYLVDHSAAIILFNPEGHYQALFNVPHDPQKIAADFVAIRNWYEASR
ncbi:protein SCO1/2 [Thiogranum longum]|uniref:Protein SCO1/2 n=1 Tax=Thiogranum longum TaxID=1537524 RepID=A0A4R1HBL0_9GAMM|nr:SCO family protein [Thiogranum longum]TCK18788.1 protein SCO1/2 [Thiogranum longum]